MAKTKEKNKEFIKELIKFQKFNYSEIDDLREEFEISGYYVGILSNRVILYDSMEGLTGIRVRPYSIKYLVDVIELEPSQKLDVFCRGKRTTGSNDNLDFNHEYYHVDFYPAVGFMDLNSLLDQK